jgi:hypothetical protein
LFLTYNQVFLSLLGCIPILTQCFCWSRQEPYVSIFFSTNFMRYLLKSMTSLSNNPDIHFRIRDRKRWMRVKGGSECFTGALVKTLKLANYFFYKFWFQIWFQKYYISLNDTQFLINKHKNKGRFLFIGAPMKHSLPQFMQIQKRWTTSLRSDAMIMLPK